MAAFSAACNSVWAAGSSIRTDHPRETRAGRLPKRSRRGDVGGAHVLIRGVGDDPVDPGSEPRIAPERPDVPQNAPEGPDRRRQRRGMLQAGARVCATPGRSLVGGAERDETLLDALR